MPLREQRRAGRLARNRSPDDVDRLAVGQQRYRQLQRPRAGASIDDARVVRAGGQVEPGRLVQCRPECVDQAAFVRRQRAVDPRGRRHLDVAAPRVDRVAVRQVGADHLGHRRDPVREPQRSAVGRCEQIEVRVDPPVQGERLVREQGDILGREDTELDDRHAHRLDQPLQARLGPLAFLDRHRQRVGRHPPDEPVERSGRHRELGGDRVAGRRVAGGRREGDLVAGAAVGLHELGVRQQGRTGEQRAHLVPGRGGGGHKQRSEVRGQLLEPGLTGVERLGPAEVARRELVVGRHHHAETDQ